MKYIFLAALVLTLFGRSLGRFTPWATGKEYVYHLYGLSVSDIPELGPMSAGVKIDAQVVVQSRDFNSISVKLVDVTASSFHTNLENNWDILYSNEGGATVANIEGRMYLERPFIITHRDGLVDSISISRDEPVWSVNFKKALASKLQIHVSGTKVLGGGLGQNFAASNLAAEDLTGVYQVMEDGVTGQCETLYQIAPLSEALIRSDPRLNPLPEVCSEGSHFQIVKTKDYNKCRVNPVYNVVSPPGWQCHHGASSCKTSSLRSSITRYVACGTLDSFSLLKVTHDGRVRLSPYGYQTQQLQAESIMKLVLQTIRPITSRQTREADLGRSIDSLVYSFNTASLEGSAGGKMRLPSLRDVDKVDRPFTFENFRTEARRLFAEVAHDVGQSGDIATKGVVDKIATIARGLQSLDYNEIKALLADATLPNTTRRADAYADMYSASMYTNPERTILLDAVMAVGSNPAVMVIKDAIASRQLSVEEASQAISGLPMFIRTPTPELLEQLLAMARSEPVVSNKQLYHTALLSLAQIAHVACVNQSEAAVRFPISLYGQFCSPSDSFIMNGLIPLLANELKGSVSTDKLVALTALGELGHEAIIPVVLPVIEGHVDVSPLVRTKAVIALHKLAHDANPRAVDILSNVFQNPSENSEVRMAAFSLLVLSNQPAFRWQRAASSTWFEPSAQVAAFVYTALQTLANSVHPTANIKEAVEKARAVLPLAKPVPLGLQYSHKIVWSHAIPLLKAGVEFHSEMFVSENSFIPKNYYSRLSWALGAFYTDMYEFEVYAENLLNAWSQIKSKLFPGVSRPVGNGTPVSPSMYGNIHPDWLKVREQLSLKHPYETLAAGAEAGQPEAFIHLTIMKTIHRLITLDETTITDLIDGLARGNQAVTSGIAVPFNIQKWLPLLNSEIVLPSTLGFPITTKSYFHVYSSFQGNFRGGVNVDAMWNAFNTPAANRDTTGTRTSDEDYDSGTGHAATNTSVPGVDEANVGYDATTTTNSSMYHNVPGSDTYREGGGARVPEDTSVPGVDRANIGYDNPGAENRARNYAHGQQGNMNYRQEGNMNYGQDYYTSPRTGFENIFGSTPGASGKYGFETNIRPWVVLKLVSKLGINAGFTRYHSVSGVDTHLMLSLPGRLTAGVDINNLKLLLSWKPRPGEHNTWFHYHVRPFTSLQMDNDWTPVTASPKTKDVAAVNSRVSTHLRPIGRDWLGLGLTWTSKSDLPDYDFASHMPGISLESLATAVNFLFMPGTIHRRYYSLSHDAAASDTSEIRASLNFELADKAMRGSQVYGPSVDQSGGANRPNQMRILSGPVEPQVARRLRQVLDAVESGSAFHMDGSVVMNGQTPKVYQASLVGGYGAYGSNSSVVFQLQFPSPRGGNPFVLCAEAGGRYPNWPAMDRKSHLDANSQVQWNARLGYGNSCDDHVVNVTAQMRRSASMDRHIRDSAENRACADEERRGEFGSENCEAVRQTAPLLDEYEIDIDYTNLTPGARNITLAVERFLRAWLYSSMAENSVGVQNQANQIRLVAKVHEDLSTVDVMVYRPDSNAFFYNVPIPPVMNVLFPLSSSRKTTHRLMDQLMGSNYLPTCRLDRGSVTTFDKVQYDAPINDCDYVALSVTGPDTLGILVREVANKKILTVYLDNNKVELSPLDNRVRINNMEVKVGTHQPVILRSNSELMGHLAMVRLTPDAALEVDAPTHGIKVVTNGKSAVVQASHFLRGKVTGLCGDMNSEVSPELRDARSCVLSSGPLMTAAFLVPETERKCTGIPEEIRSQLRQEQASCVRKSDNVLAARASSVGSASSAASCTTMRTVMVYRGRRKCFSTQAVPECRAGCQPVDTIAKNLGFHCLPEGKLADLMEVESRLRPIASMNGKTEAFRTTVYVPTACQEF